MNVKRLARFAGCVVLALGLPLPALAQTAGQLTITQFSLFPGTPSDSDSMVVTVEGSRTGICGPEELVILAPFSAGGPARIELVGCADSRTQTFSLEVELGIADAGSRSIELSADPSLTGDGIKGDEPVVVSKLDFNVSETDTLELAANVAAATCTPDSPNACNDQNPPRNPCTLEQDLRRVIQGSAPVYNWAYHLNLTFSNWGPGGFGSENLPVIAAAVGLFYQPGGPGQSWDLPAWWSTFLGCQIGESCSLPTSNRVRYFKGSEYLSATYDPPVTESVAAVNLWATLHGNTELARKARLYLQKTWALYALAAGPLPPGVRRHVNVEALGTFYQGDCQNPVSTALTERCVKNTSGNYTYDGPFVAMPGGRQVSDHFCDQDRSTLLARATNWNFSIAKEPARQCAVLKELQTRWPGNSYSENVYGNTSARAALLRNVVNGIGLTGTNSNIDAVVTILQGVKFTKTMRFLGWPGVRATVLEANPQFCKEGCTVNTFASRLDQNPRETSYIYPWTTDRKQVTVGYAKLSPNVTNPTKIEASNLNVAAGENLAGPNPTTAPWCDCNSNTNPAPKACVQRPPPALPIEISLPSTGFLYEVVIGNFATYRQ